MPLPSNPRLDLALAAANQAGELLLSYFRRRSFSTEQKVDGSPVTTADREAEQLIRRLVHDAFPTDGVLGEEFGETPAPSGYRWIIDPIDGTTSFIHGVPLWGTLIGIEHEGRMVAGVIHMPALAESIYAAAGGGAWHSFQGAAPRLAHVSSTSDLQQAMLCITSLDYFTRNNREAAFFKLARATRSMRGWSDCYSHLLLATGRCDAVVEPGVHPWDMAASLAIIPEAGGACTDWEGKPSAYSGNGILSNGAIHDGLLSTVRSA
ncbi:MAG: histidinol-phosphatase [Phycisphaeraceae bacterium]|nr:histidinol-phosphatase [Phycisphaeraceae bacterium]